MLHKWLILVAAAGLLPALHGCGGNSSGGASGSVAFDGRPVANGTITFLPEDGKGPVVAVPISDGRYRIDNIPLGRKIVQIIGLRKINFARSQDEMAQAAKANSQHGDASGIVERADEIPSNADGNNTVVEVQPGKAELNFSLTSPPVPAAVTKSK